MSLEEALTAVLDARITPLVAQIGALTAEVAQLRRSQPPALASLAEAADRLGLSLSTIRRRVRDGSIPTRRVGRRVLVDLNALRPLDDVEVAQMAREARLQSSAPVGSAATVHGRSPLAAVKKE